MTQMTPSQSISQSAQSDWPQGAIPKRWIESLFERMEFSYGEKFTRQWGSVEPHKMQRFWAIELGALSGDQLKVGVDAMKTHEWPPTLPEFVAMCKPAINIDGALYEAIEQMRKRKDGTDRWSKPEIYWAAVKIGEFDLLNVPHGQLVKRFAAALAEVMWDKIEPVPPRMVALPAPGKAVANKERVDQEVAKIKAIQKDGPGNLAWAKKIIERHKAGEKLAYITLRMAETALSRGVQK